MLTAELNSREIMVINNIKSLLAWGLETSEERFMFMENIMMTDFSPFNGDTGNFIVFIRKMNPSSLYSFRMGQALCLELWMPWRVRQTCPCLHGVHGLVGRWQIRNQRQRQLRP